MSKTRLNQNMRDRLLAMISRLPGPAREAMAVHRAYKRAAPLVTAGVEKRFPPTDMAVCKRYKVAVTKDDIQLSLTAGGIQKFNFDTGAGPLEPKRGYETITHMVDKKTSKAVSDWVMARNVLNGVCKKRALDYQALVASARTMEEIIAVWPDAQEVLPSTVGKELVALSSEAIDRILADVVARRLNFMKAA